TARLRRHGNELVRAALKWRLGDAASRERGGHGSGIVGALVPIRVSAQDHSSALGSARSTLAWRLNQMLGAVGCEWRGAVAGLDGSVVATGKSGISPDQRIRTHRNSCRMQHL